jgi:hypothetical protein
MIVGYKAFGRGLMAENGLKCEVGSTYTCKELHLYWNGFHFYENPFDLAYQSPGCEYAVIEVVGRILHELDQSVTDGMRIIRRITRSELLSMPDGKFKTHSGDVYYFLNNAYHRSDDHPAIIRTYGRGSTGIVNLEGNTLLMKEWWMHGLRHRKGGQPAIECANGDKYYYVQGVPQKNNILDLLFKKIG